MRTRLPQKKEEGMPQLRSFHLIPVYVYAPSTIIFLEFLFAILLCFFATILAIICLHLHHEAMLYRTLPLRMDLREREPPPKLSIAEEIKIYAKEHPLPPPTPPPVKVPDTDPRFQLALILANETHILGPWQHFETWGVERCPPNITISEDSILPSS